MGDTVVETGVGVDTIDEEVRTTMMRVSLSLGLSLTLNESVSPGCVHHRGGDNSLGHIAVNNWGSVGVSNRGQVVSAIDTSGVGVDTSSVGGNKERVSFSLWLGLSLGLSLTLDEVGAIDLLGAIGVGSGVGDDGAGHCLVDERGSHSLDDRVGVDQGLVQVSVGLSSQVLDLGGLDRQGVARGNSSVGMLHLGVDLGVGIAIDQRLMGKEHLRVSLWGSLGSGSQSNSDESLHY